MTDGQSRDWAAERFVSITTYRKDGTPVATPVWVVPDGLRLRVWTPAESWKVKRLHRDPRCTLRPCDRRGRVEPGAQFTVTIDEDKSTVAGTEQAIKEKYGVEYRLIGTAEKVLDLVKRRHTRRASLLLTPVGTPA